MYREGRAWAEISKANLIHNTGEFLRIAGAGCRLMPAVKANAYGHGDILVSHILQEQGIRDFCVASAEEGIRLRQAGITGQILILGYTDPELFHTLGEYQLTQTVVDAAYARSLSRYGKPVFVHVGVDSGMHRLGIPAEDPDAAAAVWSLPNLRVTGMFSHLCVSDGTTEEARDYTRRQFRLFRQLTGELYRRGIRGFETHIQGSYGILNYPEERFDCVRPGIAMYGVLSSPSDQVLADVSLRPVLSLKARVECVKKLSRGESAGYGLTYTARDERKIAVIAAGYADGIPRSLSNRGHVLIRGQKAPVIGRICMDQLTADVTDIPRTAPGDEAVFIGRSGELALTAEEMAEEAGTISNEILSGWESASPDWKYK